MTPFVHQLSQLSLSARLRLNTEFSSFPAPLLRTPCFSRATIAPHQKQVEALEVGSPDSRLGWRGGSRALLREEREWWGVHKAVLITTSGIQAWMIEDATYVNHPPGADSQEIQITWKFLQQQQLLLDFKVTQGADKCPKVPYPFY